jgi:hypothetical protein
MSKITTITRHSSMELNHKGTEMKRQGLHTSLLVLAVAGALALAGCNQAAEEVNRVQTNLVDKSIFEGEWWMSTTILDVDTAASEQGILPFTGAMAFSDLGVDQGSSYHMARIRWVIDEDHLFAYRAYELIDGGNDDGREADFRGQPLAAFEIVDHVNIQCQYNPITGECQNVTQEDTTDTRWYERDYMRVDWSMNHVESFYTVSDVSGMQAESVPFDIQERGANPQLPDSWKPQFVRIGEDPDYRFADEWPAEMQDTVHYMSVVNMTLMSPGENCLLFGQPCQTWSIPTRLGFLRVPPEHDYAAARHTHREYDRFGIIRSEQRTYVRGGQDQGTVRRRCDTNEECGAGGFCNTERHICEGGLTEDYGETDFLTFYRSRHNFFRNNLTDVDCRSDWECNGTYEGMGEPGSVCDRSAQRCTVPPQDREPRTVTYHLDAGYPAHLVPAAFQVMGTWNEVFVKGFRTVQGEPLPNYEDVRIDCQNDDPTQYCFCGAPEDTDGTCRGKYDPFVTPEEWADRGVTNPYRCHVQRPEGYTEPTNAASYDDYAAPTVYQHEMVGEECYLTLESNTCDKMRQDPSMSCDEVASTIRDEAGSCEATADCPTGSTCQAGVCEMQWEQLGDLRYQFFHYIDHEQAWFCGVSQPLSDPTNGELIVSNANMAGGCVERAATNALEYYPVLRGEVSEEYYLQGENIRGYFDRLGHTEHPVALAVSGTDGFTVEDQSRPALPANLSDFFQGHLENRLPDLQQLRGREGRGNIMSDRLERLAGTPLENRVLGSMGPNGRDLLERTHDTRKLPRNAQATDPGLIDQVSPFRGGGLKDQLLGKFETQNELSSMFIDPGYDSLFQNRFHRYFADKFEGRPRAEAALRMEQATLRSVMNHEMGHSVGLHHNFAGSLDRNHYFDAYFDVVVGDPEDPSDDLALPRIDEFDEPRRGGDADGFVEGEEVQRYLAELRRVRNERAARGAGNTMTSSIMDYGGDMSDLVYGLGRYDVAATMYSYFEKVEGYEGNPRATRADTLNGIEMSRDVGRTWFTGYQGGQSCTVTEAEEAGVRQAMENGACPFARGSAAVEGQPITQRCIKNTRRAPLPELCTASDDNCVCSAFDDDFEDFKDGVTYDNNDQDGDGRSDFYPVVYQFCENSRVFDISWCNQFDAGESFQEIIDHYRREWEENYPLNYYRRFRRSGPMSGSATRWIVDAAKIYQHLFFRLFFEPGFLENTGPLGFNDQFLSSVDAMNWFIEIVNLPDTGSYDCDVETGTCRHMGEAMDMAGSTFSLRPGEGYPMWSDYQEGHQGWFRQERAGVFTDKMTALMALALRDWGFSFTIDERYFINFHDLFPLEMTEFFGGMIQDDPTWFAPRVRMEEGTPQVGHLNWYRGTVLGECQNSAGDRVPCRGSQRDVFPVGEVGGGNRQFALEGTSNEILRDWATMLALAEFPVFYDTSFEQRLSIYKLDNGDGFDIPEVTEGGGTPCAYGDSTVETTHTMSCTREEADYVVYKSDRFHTPYVAIKIRPRIEYNLEEEQLGFQLLAGLYDNKMRIEEIEGLASPTPDQLDEMDKRREQLQRDESYLELLIEIQRQYGISSYF